MPLLVSKIVFLYGYFVEGYKYYMLEIHFVFEFLNESHVGNNLSVAIVVVKRS